MQLVKIPLGLTSASARMDSLEMAFLVKVCS